jgi:hypothetical protein
MDPKRHGDYRFWIVLQSFDEIIDLIHTLFNRRRRGSAGLSWHDGSPKNEYADDTSMPVVGRRLGQGSDSDFWCIHSEITVVARLLCGACVSAQTRAKAGATAAMRRR